MDKRLDLAVKACPECQLEESNTFIRGGIATVDGQSFGFLAQVSLCFEEIKMMIDQLVLTNCTEQMEVIPDWLIYNKPVLVYLKIPVSSTSIKIAGSIGKRPIALIDNSVMEMRYDLISICKSKKESTT